MGELLTSRGELTRARVFYHQAIALDGGAAARNAFGCFLLNTDCAAEARTEFSRLLQQADSMGNLSLRAVACNNLAAACRALGESARATSWQQQSWNAATPVPSGGDEPRDQLGCDLGNRATDAILAGDYALAEQLIRISLAWEQTSGTRAGEADDWGNLGLVAGLQGHLAAAAAALRRARHLHRQAGDTRSEGCDLLHLGEVFLQAGRWQRSARLFASAGSVFRSAHLPRLARRASQHLAHVRRLLSRAAHDPLRN
jgi:Tfp pilus assembly protein PilF